jgi:hypothetical protein
MFQNAKISYDEHFACHRLSFDAPDALFLDRVLDVVSKKLPDNPMLAMMHLLDDSDLPFFQLDGRDMWIWNEMDESELRITISIPAETDKLDGTIWSVAMGEPVDLDLAWAKFVPICRELLKLAA